MKIENNQSKNQNLYNEQVLINNVIEKYDYYEQNRTSQLSDNRLIRYAIYNSDIPKVNGWDANIQLPEIYELAQTLKSHIVQICILIQMECLMLLGLMQKLNLLQIAKRQCL